MKNLEQNLDFFESKTQIDLPVVVLAHKIENNAIGRMDDGTRILYINLVCECTNSNKQKGTGFYII